MEDELRSFLNHLLTPKLFPKRVRTNETAERKKKLKKLRQIIKLLETYPDKPTWQLLATFGPFPKNGNKPHSMMDALKTAQEEERRLLLDGRRHYFLGRTCMFRGRGNVELARNFFVSDLIGDVLFEGQSQFSFWKSQVKDKRLPFTERAIIKQIRDFRKSPLHCENVVTMKLLAYKGQRRPRPRTLQEIKRKLAWRTIDSEILRLLLQADQHRDAQSSERTKAQERRRIVEHARVAENDPKEK